MLFLGSLFLFLHLDDGGSASERRQDGVGRSQCSREAVEEEWIASPTNRPQPSDLQAHPSALEVSQP